MAISKGPIPPASREATKDPNDNKKILLTVGPEEYAEIERRAERLGVKPSTYVYLVVRLRLSRPYAHIGIQSEPIEPIQPERVLQNEIAKTEK